MRLSNKPDRVGFSPILGTRISEPSVINAAQTGKAASGKGTVSKAISEKLQFNYLDTGKLYRAIGAKYLEGYPPVDAAQSQTVMTWTNMILKN